MGASHNSGPEIIYGPSSSTSNPNINPIFGPSATYQGDCILDPRYTYRPGQDSRPNTVKGFLDTPYHMLLDTTPPALNTVGIVPAAALTADAVGTALVMSACLSVSAATIAVAGTGYDPGWQVFTVNSGTAIGSKASFAIYVVGGIPQGTPVLLAGGAYSVTPTVAASATTGPTGSGLTLNLTVAAPSIFDSTGTLRTGLYAIDCPYQTQAAGVVAAYNPRAALTRNVTVTGSASLTTGTLLISGYDLYGVAMSEQIVVPGSATTTQGKKAFKYISGVTVAAGFGSDTTHTVAVGFGDIIGINIRSNLWEYTNFYYNGSFLTASTGWTAAVQTVATATTGDIRGTYAVQSATDGTKRLAMFLSAQLFDLTLATPYDATTMFGVAQF